MPSTPLDLDTIPANTWRSVEPQLNLLANTLKPGVVVQPFSAVDLGRLFPAQAAPSWQPQHNLLLGTVPFRPVDQPLLQGVKGLFSFEQQNLLTSTLTPATAASPFRPIDFGPPQVTVRLGEFTTPNLLTSTLAPQQATPFTPADFSALSKVTGPQEYKPADLLTGVLLGQIQPFNQLAWPALTPTSQQPQVPAGANLALLTTPAPKPFFQVDWPALPIPLKLEPFLIPNTTINQVAPVAPPNLHKLYYDVSSGRLFWRVSETANPIEIVPL
jgi:hypothetical protein